MGPPKQKENMDPSTNNLFDMTVLKEALIQILPSLMEGYPGKELEEGRATTQKTNQGDLICFRKLCGGYDGSQDVRDFLHTVESQFLTLEIQPQNQTKFVCSCLSGSAAKWLLTQQGLREKPWLDFKQKILRQFSPSTISESDLMRFIRLKQTGSMSDHITKSRELCRGIPSGVPEPELLRIFRSTLKERDQRILAAMDFNTLEEAFEAALRLASVVDTSDPEVNINRGFMDPRAARKCYNCGKEGHIAKFCRQKESHRDKPRDQGIRSDNPRRVVRTAKESEIEGEEIEETRQDEGSEHFMEASHQIAK